MTWPGIRVPHRGCPSLPADRDRAPPSPPQSRAVHHAGLGSLLPDLLPGAGTGGQGGAPWPGAGTYQGGPGGSGDGARPAGVG